MVSEKTRSIYGVSDAPALCVDLDGTLLATDVLWESVLLLLKRKPHLMFLLPFWLLKGKAALKHNIAQKVRLDVANLPYRQDVLDFLIEEKDSGRHIVLATASDRKAAEAIANHLGLFSDVIASDGIENLSGIKKREALEARFSDQGFDYIGNSRVDLPLWEAANAALLVDPSKRMLAKARRKANVKQVFSTKTNRLRTIVKALRCYQWVKNLLVFVPLIMAHKLSDQTKMLDAFWAFCAFSLCASGIYILNDLADLKTDRLHPKKRLRPFACGKLSIPAGLMLSVALLTGAFTIAAAALPFWFSAGLLFYMIVTLAYSFYLKRTTVADVMTLAGLYTLRVLLGGVATGIGISTWLLEFSMFFFLCLAFVKRYTEFDVLQMSSEGRLPGRGYIAGDKDWMLKMGSGSGYLSVLVLALYINDDHVADLYNHPKLLLLICPALLYWISRLWLLTSRGYLEDDPIVFAIKDVRSYLIGIIIAAILVAATF